MFVHSFRNISLMSTILWQCAYLALCIKYLNIITVIVFLCKYFMQERRSKNIIYCRLDIILAQLSCFYSNKSCLILKEEEMSKRIVNCLVDISDTMFNIGTVMIFLCICTDIKLLVENLLNHWTFVSKNTFSYIIPLDLAFKHTGPA